MAELEAAYGRAPGYIAKNLLPKALSGQGLGDRTRSDKGTAKKFTPEVDAKVAEKSREWRALWSAVRPTVTSLRGGVNRALRSESASMIRQPVLSQLCIWCPRVGPAPRSSVVSQ